MSGHMLKCGNNLQSVDFKVV